MNLLFLHQNFPGQFRHIAAHFAAGSANRVVAIFDVANRLRAAAAHPGIELRPYASPSGAHAATHGFVRGHEAAVRRGLAATAAAKALLAEGFVPDLIVAHPGWGEALFLRDVFPAARIVQHAEFFYQATGADVGFDPEFPPLADAAYRVRMKNTTQLLSMEQADLLIAPTQWQKSRFPALLGERIAVAHEGIDTTLVRPDPRVRITLAKAGVTLSAGDEVVTYVARNLEPYRGFHVFMRALPGLLRARPRARVLIVGGDQVSYGSKPADGETWRARMLAEVGGQIDAGRVHFLGRLPYESYLRLLQVSAVHAYLTYPFVLSWSMLEAMAAGCMVVGSRTAPVEEVIKHGENGWLVDFFDHRQLAEALAGALEERSRLDGIRQAARRTVVERFDLTTVCLPRQLEILQASGLRLSPE
jgi:glycosyltransferase involved in cell wall biosynthesis